MKPEMKMRTEMTFAGVPEHNHEGLINWMFHGIRPGGFLTEVLANNLSGAVRLADRENGAALLEIVRFMIQHAPGQCWGSRNRVREWPEVLAKQREDQQSQTAERE